MKINFYLFFNHSKNIQKCLNSKISLQVIVNFQNLTIQSTKSKIVTHSSINDR